MKKILIFACAFLFVSSVVFAAPPADQGKKGPSPAQLAQQEKMKSCSTEAKAKNLKGAERQKFMSECLKGKTTTPPAAQVVIPVPPSTKQDQQGKMKTCNAEAKAKNLKGIERQKFMSDCLKADKK